MFGIPNLNDLENLTAVDVVAALESGGLSVHDANELVGNWVLTLGNRAKRVFNYKTDFDENDASCVTNFARSFLHEDWIDGEDLVQAEETAGERGFNWRFHRLEDDIDALGADLARAFLCLAEMRADIFALLQEIRTEINRLNSDVFECCEDKGPVRPGLPDFVAPDFATAEFLGSTNFMNKDYFVWDSPSGVMLFPSVASPVVEAVDPLDDPRVINPGLFGEFMLRDEVVEFFRINPITKEALVDKFGGEALKDDLTVADVVKTLPATVTYNTTTEMVKDLAQRSAAALRLSALSGAAIASNLGVGTDVGFIGEASVDSLRVVSREAGTALIDSGTGTLEELAGADPEVVARNLTNAGVKVTTGEAAGWIAIANTLTLIR